MKHWIIAALTAVFYLHTSATASAEDSINLTLDWSPIGQHAPIYLAIQKGWFKQGGVDIDLHDGKGSTTTIQLVAAHSADVGYVQLASMVAAIDNGIKVTSVSGYVRAGDNGFILPVDSAIHEPKDFLGKRIAFPLGGSSSALLDAFWRTVGLNSSQMTLVGVDPSAITSTYITGNIDAAVSPIAALSPLVEAQRPSRAIPYAQYGLRVPSYGLVVRAADVQDRSAQLAKLVPILSRAWSYVADGHSDEAVDAMLAQRAAEKLDRSVMLAQLNETLKLVYTPDTKGKPMGWQSENDWKSAIAVLKGAGIVKHDLPIDTYFTNAFVPKGS